jgi:hypothetical protein
MDANNSRIKKRYKTAGQGLEWINEKGKKWRGRAM